MLATSLSKVFTSYYWKDYLELCKPKVVALMLLTAVVGMFLAPGKVTFSVLLFSLIGIGFCAGSAATINHLVDRHIDAIMLRTQRRPIAYGRVTVKQGIFFALILAILGLLTLSFFVNNLTAWLTFASIIGYALIYTGYLKRATPQNIVIGGLAGAAPPLLGWTAVTNHIDPQALLLVLIIFTWTPPHFWALAIYRAQDYKNANIPMLPITHGIAFTKTADFTLYHSIISGESSALFDRYEWTFICFRCNGIGDRIYLLGSTAI
jgi:protoheme IX farnesyltransferase